MVADATDEQDIGFYLLEAELEKQMHWHAKDCEPSANQRCIKVP
jgi:hypothetical protein